MNKFTEYKPLVSIALATYNGERFLRKQLDSLIAQEYPYFEIVISDDGSTDNTLSILKEYQTRDSRVKCVSNPIPQGFIKNFEYAISLCKGDIIFLCDQDDIWYSEKIDAHVRVYQETSISWVYNRVVLINDKDKEIGCLEDTAVDYYKKRRLLDHTWGSCILGCATSYRTTVLRSVMPSGNYAPAHDSWIQLALFPQESFYIDRVLQVYRIHNSNTVGWGEKMSEDLLLKREEQSIADNFHYLKNLPKNKNLAYWKRLFFAGVYILKIVRLKLRQFVLK